MRQKAATIWRSMTFQDLYAHLDYYEAFSIHFLPWRRDRGQHNVLGRIVYSTRMRNLIIAPTTPSDDLEQRFQGHYARALIVSPNRGDTFDFVLLYIIWSDCIVLRTCTSRWKCISGCKSNSSRSIDRRSELVSRLYQSPWLRSSCIITLFTISTSKNTIWNDNDISDDTRCNRTKDKFATDSTAAAAAAVSANRNAGSGMSAEHIHTTIIGVQSRVRSIYTLAQKKS